MGGRSRQRLPSGARHRGRARRRAWRCCRKSWKEAGSPARARDTRLHSAGVRTACRGRAGLVRHSSGVTIGLRTTQPQVCKEHKAGSAAVVTDSLLNVSSRVSRTPARNRQPLPGLNRRPAVTATSATASFLASADPGRRCTSPGPLGALAGQAAPRSCGRKHAQARQRTRLHASHTSATAHRSAGSRNTNTAASSAGHCSTAPTACAPLRASSSVGLAAWPARSSAAGAPLRVRSCTSSAASAPDSGAALPLAPPGCTAVAPLAMCLRSTVRSGKASVRAAAACWFANAAARGLISTCFSQQSASSSQINECSCDLAQYLQVCRITQAQFERL